MWHKKKIFLCNRVYSLGNFKTIGTFDFCLVCLIVADCLNGFLIKRKIKRHHSDTRV